MKRLLSLCALVFASNGVAHAQKIPTSVLEVRGDVGAPRAYKMSELRSFAPAQLIKTTFKGQPYTARGIALWPLLEAAAPRLDTKVKHSEARFVLLARGADGYLASLAYPEVSPSVGGKGAFIVWEANSKPLSGKDGPLRLVVIGDKKPMRWVYNLVAIEIYDAKQLSKG